MVVTISVVTASALAMIVLSRWNRKRNDNPTDDDDDNNDQKKKKNHQKPMVLIQDVMEKTADGKSLVLLQQIGVVHSVYRLCVGTPRQGLLAPHARGTIQLEIPQAAVSVQGLERFSHIWIVFVFHLNTVRTRNSAPSPAKIAPPALGGTKVGTFATRSPHHYNPIGITLAKLERIRTVKQYINSNNKQKLSTVTYLDVSGIDLVHGTPVLDIKPYVATYDAPPEYSTVPSWVSEGLNQQRSVQFTNTAKAQLHEIVCNIPDALEFYNAQDYEKILACIQEVLAVDVRSSYQTHKARNGKYRAEQSQRLQQQQQQQQPSNATTTTGGGCCTQQIDNLLVSYTVHTPTQQPMNRSESIGSGAEDHVLVTSIQIWNKTTTSTTTTTTTTITDHD
jgi:tRNA-Thr(GGU) m(6)t(6)A37 methyltransferase TsaA